MNLLAILFDLGDVIMQEETEVKDAELSTLRADLVDGIADALRALKKRGYKLGLVADTRPKTYFNVLHQHNLYELFDAFAISEQVGAEKPDARLFEAALTKLGIARQDYSRVVMIGNNLARDIRGANALGIISIWFHWNDRYARTDDKPSYEVKSAAELIELVERI